MANRRTLKNSINYLTNELIIEALTYQHFHSTDLNRDKITSVIEKILATRNNLISRVNHVNGKNNNKLTKTHFTSIQKEIPTLVETLDELVKK